MRHCVAASAAACAEGNCVIVSVRSPAGERLSTAELRLYETVPHVRAVQHRAARNGAPQQDCAAALDALLRHLNGAAQAPALEARLALLRQQAARGSICGAGAMAPMAPPVQRRGPSGGAANRTLAAAGRSIR